MPPLACSPAHQLHPALASRFSPVLFDESVVVTSAQVDVLLEAARRAPSAGNSQPWRFIVARRGDAIVHGRGKVPTGGHVRSPRVAK